MLFQDATQLTVSQLIELLAKCPPDLRVMVQGCDCYGLASGVEVLPDAVYICREDYLQ